MAGVTSCPAAAAADMWRRPNNPIKKAAWWADGKGNQNFYVLRVWTRQGREMAGSRYSPAQREKGRSGRRSGGSSMEEEEEEGSGAPIGGAACSVGVRLLYWTSWAYSRRRRYFYQSSLLHPPATAYHDDPLANTGMVVLAPHTTETGSPKSPTFAQIEESEQLKKMEEEKAAAAATKPESSSEEAFDETKGDNNDVTKSEGSSTTASGAVEEDKPLKDGSASNKPTDPLKVIKRASDKPTDPPKVIKQRRRPKPLDRERAELNALIFVSLLVAVFTLITLWRNRGKPLLFLGFVWQLSLLISLSSFLWINFLKVMHTLVVFLSLSQVCLLAAFAHHTLSPAIGMFTVQLSTHFAAGFLGCALAQRRLLQPQATDRYEIPMPDNEEAERLHVLRIAAGLLYGLPTLGVAIRLAWVLSHSADYAPTDLMLHFLMPLSGGLLLWISFIASVLRGALMGQGGLALVFFYFGFIMMNYMLMLVTLGHTVATLATWFAILGLSGFLGYSIGVYNFFKEIQMTRVTRDSVPQASPLQ